MTVNTITTRKTPASIGPYVQVVNANNFVFLSGQIPICPTNNEIPNGIVKQTNQTLFNIKAILETVHLKISNIIKTTIFMKNLNDLIIFNKIYEDFFIKNEALLPARSCIEVNRLPKDVLIEIEVIAVCYK